MFIQTHVAINAYTRDDIYTARGIAFLDEEMSLLSASLVNFSQYFYYLVVLVWLNMKREHLCRK